jgi:hypothetical protein
VIKLVNEIGTIISTVDSPSTSLIKFVVEKEVLHRGMFVEIDYSEGTLISMVNNLIKTNRYFERADSVKEFESNDLPLNEQFPVSEWEFLVAEAKPLGVISGNALKRPTFPPSPGLRVKIASNENIKKFLNFDDEKGLHLGEIEFHGIPVKLNLSRLLAKHLMILSISGAGKSYLTSVLLEELLDRKKEFGRIAVVVLDVHGEYGSFALPVTKEGFKDYSSKTKIVKASDFKIGVPRLSTTMLAAMMPGLSLPQKRDLGKVLKKLKQEMKEGLGPFNLRTIINEVIENPEIKTQTRDALIAWLSSLEETNLFAKMDSPAIEEIVKPGILTIVDLSPIIDMKKKHLIVNYFAQKLFHERRLKKLPPFLLVLEEAHQFIPESASSETAIARSIFETIAREGRKFGASLCLISQRPIRLSTTVLSQCNTGIFLRITNPYDLEHIKQSAEALDHKSAEMISSLRVGEALIVGEAVGFPLFFRVRRRKSMESVHEISLEEAAKSFEETHEKLEKEAKDFIK